MVQMKYFPLLFFIFITSAVLAQTQEDLTKFNEKRLHTNKLGMTVLGAWAIANIGTNLILVSKASGESKYFYQMNAGWNLVNLALAVPAYLSAVKGDASVFSAYATLQEHYDIEKTFLLNTGLDVGYVAAGFYLMERGKNATKKPEQLIGFGKALILQGAFLFVFDLTMFGIHHSHLKQSRMIFENLKLSNSGIGVELRF